jgi:predicted membrane-bound dolichyl-phosphate-mannose-protein mannosyltransferase
MSDHSLILWIISAIFTMKEFRGQDTQLVLYTVPRTPVAQTTQIQLADTIVEQAVA